MTVPGRCDERLVRRLDEARQEDEDGDDHGELQRRLRLGHADRHALNQPALRRGDRAPPQPLSETRAVLVVNGRKRFFGLRSGVPQRSEVTINDQGRAVTRNM